MTQALHRSHQEQEDLRLIILAAGDGERLSPLTRVLYGRHVPKQFAELMEGRTLLQETMARMAALVPASRTYVVVPQAWADTSRQQLSAWPSVRVVVQPANRGTALGVLLPLATVLADSPDAKVVVAASDHHVPHPAPFLQAIRSALAAASTASLALLGVEPDRPEPDYGWIVPGARLGEDRYHVADFVEKPSCEEAGRLQRAGGLWNTLVLAARGTSLWQAIAGTMPGIAETLTALWRRPRSLAAAYRTFPSASLSRSVLTGRADMTVVPVHGSGWTDWGCPERVFKSLEGTAQLSPLVRRIEQGARIRRSGGMPEQVRHGRWLGLARMASGRA